MKIYFIFIITLGFMSSSFSKENVFHVVHVKGKVWRHVNDEKIQIRKKEKLTTPFILSSEKNSLAIVKSNVMTLRVDEESSINIEKSTLDTVDIRKGSILINYLKSKVRDKYKLNVKTKTIAIGVRGTTFFVFSSLEGKSFVSVDEGVIDSKGKSSDKYLKIKSGNSSILNKKNQNLKPKKYSFQKYINWNISNLDGKMENNSKLKSSFLATWNKYKNEQEYKWKNFKKDQSSSWENWKKSNQ